MVTAVKSGLSLEEFLLLPETQPASEYINGKIQQKIMPQGEHSLLQAELCQRINQIGKSQKIAYAFPELRCNFGGRSLVPDIAVFRWSRVVITEEGKIANRFNLAPDWSIEILSSEQNQTKVLDNLLHCSEHGTELGWLIDPLEETVLIVKENQQVKLLRNKAMLPVLKEINLSLRVGDIFNWLTWT